MLETPFFSQKEQTSVGKQESKSSVLVIDDDLQLNNMLEAMLSENDYAIVTATCPIEGLDIADTSEPDIVLLDIKMPKLDGFEVLKKLKANFTAASIPVIVITGDDDPEHLRNCFKAGARDYVYKVNLTREIIPRIENQKKSADRIRALREQNSQLLGSHRSYEQLVKKFRELIEQSEGSLESSQPFGASQNIQDQEQLRLALVQVLSLSLQCWERTTGLTKIDLIEQSKIWRVHIDANGTFRTRTFDKYLNAATLPKKPRWRQVVQTSYFVLDQAEEDSGIKHELEEALAQLHVLLQN